MKQRYFPNIMCSLLLADDKLRPFVGNAQVVTGGGLAFNYCHIITKFATCVSILMQVSVGLCLCVYTQTHTHTHRVSQEERTKLREGVPYVKLY